VTTTSQLTTFSDLYLDLESRVRVTSGITATENIAKRYINIALQDMHMGTDYRYPWAERNARLVTQQSYTAGTLAYTQGSASITGTSTLWNTNNAFAVTNARANGKIIFGGSMTPYIVQTVASDTSITLSSKVTDATATGSSYTYFEDEYALASDFLRTVDMQRFTNGPISIDLISRTEFRRRYPDNRIPQPTPSVACILDYAPSGNTTLIRRVRLAPPPSNFLTIPYDYITANLVTSSAGVAQTGFTADTDEPIMPLRYRHAIVFHALYNWYRDRKDDERADKAKAEYTDIMMRIMSDAEVGGVRPQFRPRVQDYVRAARNPYSYSGRRY
jgi:hypothetical protein